MKKIIASLALVMSFAAMAHATEQCFISTSGSQYNLVITSPSRSAVVPFDNLQSCVTFRSFWFAKHNLNADMVNQALPDFQCVPTKIDIECSYQIETSSSQN